MSVVPTSTRGHANARTFLLIMGALACCISGCSGQVDSGRPKQRTGGSDDGASGGGGDDDDASDTRLPAVRDPGTKRIHRLNAVEYNATVADVLGTKLAPANASWRGGELGGFDNMADALDIDEDQFRRYLTAATAIADDVFTTPALRARIMTCTSDDVSCVGSIIEKTGLRLFRRPLEQQETEIFVKLHTKLRDQGESNEGAMKHVLRALLSSPDFLHRIEFDADSSATKRQALNPYELASRVSYFLWSSAPDEALLAAAADGSLRKDEVLMEHVDRMLADPARSARFVENFAGQWLGARKLPQHTADPKIFPDWSPALGEALAKELYLYFNEFLAKDRSWLDFMKADFNFVNANIAKLYGMPSPGSAELRRVEVPDDERFGFAGLGGFLALSSLGTRTSPTLRGRWILKNLLCVDPPEAPPGVEELGSDGVDPSRNVREALEEHRQNPSCAACHALLDPFGLSLERFDGIGKHRRSYADGTSIDVSAEYEDVSFEGLRGLADVVSDDPNFSQCVIEHMFTYGLGRLVQETDAPYLEAIHSNWLDGTPTLRRLAQAIVLSETFRYRRGPAAD